MTEMAQSPDELASVIKDAQIETGRFFQPFDTSFNQCVELGWDGIDFVARTAEGPLPLRTETLERLLPLKLSSVH